MRIFEKAKTVWSRYGFYISLMICGVFIAAAALLVGSGGKNDHIMKDDPDINRLSMPMQTEEEIKIMEEEKSEGHVYDESLIMTGDGQMMFYPMLSMYRTHKGVDIDTDTAIAQGDGRVLEIFDDELMGKCVKIEEMDGERLYACLETVYVGVGDEVYAGDKIGKCGIVPMEKHLGVHLHMEFY